MKKFLLLTFILVGSFDVNAQTRSAKSNIGITIGPSFPIGSFGDKDSNKSSGLAKMGGFLAIDYAYQFSKHFAAIVSAQGRMNGIDKYAISMYALPESSGAGLIVNTGVWKMGAIMGGIVHTLPLTKSGNLNFELKIMGGYQATYSPQMDVLVSVPGRGTFETSQKPISSNSFAYLFGIGLKRHLNNTLALRLNVDYFGSNPRFKGAGYIPEGPSVPIMKQDTEAINLGIGLSISF